MITLKQIEAFYWAGSLGSFSAAAVKLNTAQSTISKRLQELEAVLQIPLFDRQARVGKLTMKGSELLQIAEEFLRMQHFFCAVAGDNRPFSGLFRLGITELVALTWLPEILSAIKEAYPRITVEPHVDLVSNLYEKLEDRSIDLVVGPAFNKSDGFAGVPFVEVQQAWMCSPSLYHGDDVLTLDQLVAFPLLLQPCLSGLHAMLKRLFENNGVRPRNVISCNGMLALAQLAASGFGVTCLPRFLFAKEIETERLRIVETAPPLPDLTFVATHRRDAIGSPSEAIAAIVQQVGSVAVKPRDGLLLSA